MLFEVDFAPGLSAVVRQEIQHVYNGHVQIIRGFREDGLILEASNDTNWDLLRTINNVFVLYQFNVPRPKALLGHQIFHTICRGIEQIRKKSTDSFETLYVSAAGSESSVMQRIRDSLAHETGLIPREDEGDLLIRIRPSAMQKNAWDVLLRITKRPFATRKWRVCNMPGALSAAVASAMILLGSPKEKDIVVNIGCGSGTLMIERLGLPARQVLGIDLDPHALLCAHANGQAAGQTLNLYQGDATRLPIASQSISHVYADLPFGQLVGTHQNNVRLYPALLQEAARITKIGGKGLIISHEARLMEQSLRRLPEWQVMQEIHITLSGLHPRIYLLERLG